MLILTDYSTNEYSINPELSIKGTGEKIIAESLEPSLQYVTWSMKSYYDHMFYFYKKPIGGIHKSRHIVKRLLKHKFKNKQNESIT